MKTEIEIPFGMNPVDFFNFNIPFEEIFKDCKNCHMKSPHEACFPNPEDITTDLNKTTFLYDALTSIIIVNQKNEFNIAPGSTLSKFMLFSIVKFKNNYRAAMSHIEISLMKLEVAYCRVGCDWFKVFNKKNRYGGSDVVLKGWKKDELKEDHTKNILKVIPKYDDFIIIPDNKDYVSVHDNCYNLYCKFPHELDNNNITEEDIPHTTNFLRHIFKEHYDIGLKYFKVLYERPQQHLPILVLVSEDRVTGKTTFLNFIKMIFGENSVMVSPFDLMDKYNDSYASKNIIMTDETVFEKKHATEKLKYLSTTKYISVSQKYVQHYSLPFFGKIIMCTNKEKDFINIDSKEVRFWIRKIDVINGKKNVNIENDLFSEIPKFIKFLTHMAPIDYTRSRMVFTEQEIETDSLKDIKNESKSGLHKELELMIDDFFNNNTAKEFLATAKDIKEHWFPTDKNISRSYILKVITQEMKLKTEKNQRYFPFSQISVTEKVGRPFLFKIENVTQL